MNKFIEINNTILNVSDIRKVEFISEHIHEGLLPTIKEEYIPFNYCNIHTSSDEVIELTIDLYQIEEDMSIDEWINSNLYYIHQSMENITGILKPVKVSGFEYE